MAAKRAALYIRVSTEEQARHGYSLGEQRRNLESFAEARGLAVVGVYADEGVSARKAMSRRKELQRLLADVDAGLVDVIVIKCLDRWFRNVADFYKVQERLDARGVKWACTQEEIDTSTTAGRLMLNMRLSIAQHESDQTSDRIKYVNEGKRRRREPVSGKVPLGIAIQGKRLVHDGRAPAVLALFRYIADGHSKRSAVGYMRDAYGLRLSFYQISMALQNRAYLGERHGVKGYIEPLVPEELFGRVQEVLARNLKAAPTGRIYLFSGLIRCPCCGRTLGGRRGHASRLDGQYHNLRYVCNNHAMNGGDACAYGGGVFEKALEDFLLDNVQRLAQERIWQVELAREAGGRDIQSRLAAARARLRRLKELYLDGGMDLAEYRRDHEELAAQERELASAAARQQRIPPGLRKVVEISGLRESYGELGKERRKELWQSLIARIEFDNTSDMRKAHAEKRFRVFFR